MFKSLSMVQVEYLLEITTYKPVASETDGNVEYKQTRKATRKMHGHEVFFFFFCVCCVNDKFLFREQCGEDWRGYNNIASIRNKASLGWHRCRYVSWLNPLYKSCSRRDGDTRQYAAPFMDFVKPSLDVPRRYCFFLCIYLHRHCIDPRICVIQRVNFLRKKWIRPFFLRF